MAEQRYLVTARKYRPALFREVVAQEHVTGTLKNALRLDRLAHAYLFSGPRGVGKTTSARILAKAINCKTPRAEREDGAEPCRTCEPCRSFEEGRSLNVIELDAASNNSVNDIRELRETVRIPPQGAPKKVYILDEVHMLSTAAFNALLKTLEEPPPHALFIFATTEPHKVLPTILSRCQRFDFRRIPVPEIVAHLRSICATEGIEADEESLMLVARKGDGALRDALSAFDQAVSLCGTTLRYAELAQAMGVVDQDLFFRLTDHVAATDSAGVLGLVHHVVRTGYDLSEFLAGLTEHLRNLLVARTTSDPELIEAASSVRTRYREAAGAFTEADLLRLLLIAGDAEEDVKQSAQPRLKLEMALLKMASLTQSVDLRRVVAQIKRMEQAARDGTLVIEQRGPQAGDGGGSGAPVEAGQTKEPAVAYDAAPSTPSEAAPTSQTPPASQTPSTESSPAPETEADAPEAASSGVALPDVTPSPRTPPTTDTPAPETEADAPEVADPATASAQADAAKARAEAASADASPEAPADVPPAEADAPRTAPPRAEAATPDAPAPRNANNDDTDAADASADDDAADDDNGNDDDGAPPAPNDPQAGYLDLFGTPALPKKKKKRPKQPDASAPRASGDDAPPDAPAADAPPNQAAANTPSLPADAPPAAPDVAVAPPPEAEQDEARALRQLRASWPDLVADIKRQSMSVGVFLEEAAPRAIEHDTLVVAVPHATARDMLRSRDRQLARRLHALTGDAALQRLRFVVDAAAGAGDGAAGETPQESAPYDHLEQLKATHPTVQALFDAFNAEIVY